MICCASAPAAVSRPLWPVRCSTAGLFGMGLVVADTVSAPVLCDDGAAYALRLFVLNEGQPSSWPARASRTVGRGSHLEGRNEVEDLRSRLTAAGDRALPGAGDLPTFMLPPASGSATAASTAGPNRRGVAPYLRAGVEGAAPLASPMYAHWVGWL